MLKKVLIIFILLSFLFLGTVNATGLSVLVDGQRINFDVEPFIENGRVLVPIRFLSEELGAQVDWDAENKGIKIYLDNYIELFINNKTYSTTIPGMNTGQLDTSPVIKDGRTMVPLRFVAEAFDINVDWEPHTKTVNIVTSDTGNNARTKITEERSTISFSAEGYNLLDITIRPLIAGNDRVRSFIELEGDGARITRYDLRNSQELIIPNLDVSNYNKITLIAADNGRSFGEIEGDYLVSDGNKRRIDYFIYVKWKLK